MDTDNNICTGFVIFVKGKNYFSIFFHDAIEWKIVLKKNFSIFGSVIVESHFDRSKIKIYEIVESLIINY